MKPSELPEDPKRDYVTPEIVEYGSVKSLTGA